MTEPRISEDYDNPLERLELLAGDDDAIASFLDEIDVQSPRERELLSELARTQPLARPERFGADHRRLVASLESLNRHGYHGSRAAARIGPLKAVVREAIKLVARFIVVSYVKSVVRELHELYLLREIQALDRSQEKRMLRFARRDAEGLVELLGGGGIGVPTFVFGGLLLPVGATVWRLVSGIAFDSWVVAALVGLTGALIGVGISWIVLRGSAMASRRIRISTRDSLAALWESVGHCGDPPRDQSRTFATIAISLTVGAWIVLPAVVAVAIAS